MTFKAVFFDGYGTLFEGAMVKLMKICADIVGENDLQMTPKEFLKMWERFFFPMLQGGEFIPLRKAHIESLDCVFNFLKKKAVSDSYVARLLKHFGEVSVFSDVQFTLDNLEQQVTAVVSNADSDHLEAALSYNGLQFHTVVSSEFAKCYKPDPEIFNFALDLVGYSANEVLYVGDSQEDDIVGTQCVGMKVAWLNRDGESLRSEIPKPDYEIRSLRELLTIVR